MIMCKDYRSPVLGSKNETPTILLDRYSYRSYVGIVKIEEIQGIIVRRKELGRLQTSYMVENNGGQQIWKIDT